MWLHSEGRNQIIHRAVTRARAHSVQLARILSEGCCSDPDRRLQSHACLALMEDALTELTPGDNHNSSAVSAGAGAGAGAGADSEPVTLFLKDTNSSGKPFQVQLDCTILALKERIVVS